MTNTNNNLKIETINAGENEVSFCPERGGIITSLKFQGKEILYIEEETFNNVAVSVHGGIPILFPNAGPVESPDFPGLKEHGFARTSHTWQAEINENGFTETLGSDEEKYKSFPYNFKLSFSGKFEDDGSFTITETVENLEDTREIPLSIGLHPYFKVANDEKKNIKFNFEGGENIEKQIDLWGNGDYICVDSPMTPMEIVIPGQGSLTIEQSPEFKKVWIWSQPGKDFICIEPMMRDKGGLVTNPELISPKGIYTTSVKYLLK